MRPRQHSLRVTLATAAFAGAWLFASTPSAHADDVGYLVNVTVRPGYNFANADQAISYGRGICAKIDSGTRYSQLMADVKTDFQTTDEYQASYLITQAAQELCPGEIWQLRNSAAGYVPDTRHKRLFSPNARVTARTGQPVNECVRVTGALIRFC